MGIIDRKTGLVKTEELDPFLVQKWDHAFVIFFDIDKNKMLEWNDFELLLEKIKRKRGVESDHYQAATKAVREIWQYLCETADLNHDDKISIEEWHTMWYLAIMENEQHEWQQHYLDYTFKLLDASGDELIDLSEYVEMMQFYGMSKESAVEAFDMFAVTEDGRQVLAIDFDHYCKLWKQFFSSTDPTVPGNYVFGMPKDYKE